MDEVAKQTKKGEVWDLGGELAILMPRHSSTLKSNVNGTLGAGDVDDSAEGGYTIKRGRVGGSKRARSQRVQLFCPSNVAVSWSSWPSLERTLNPDVVEKVSHRCHHRQGQKQCRELPVLKLRPPDAFLIFFDQLRADGFCGGRGPEACASRSALFRRLASDLHAQWSILAQLLWASWAVVAPSVSVVTSPCLGHHCYLCVILSSLTLYHLWFLVYQRVLPRLHHHLLLDHLHHRIPYLMSTDTP